MRNKIIGRVFFIHALFFCANAQSAGIKSSCDAATAIVKRYIALDNNGETLKTVDSLVDYKGRDTPGWDSFQLTKESHIKSCKEQGEQVEIVISHSVFGTISGVANSKIIGDLTSKQPKEETTVVQLNKTKNGWKIDSATIYMPHVVVKKAKRMVK